MQYISLFLSAVFWLPLLRRIKKVHIYKSVFSMPHFDRLMKIYVANGSTYVYTESNS